MPEHLTDRKKAVFCIFLVLGTIVVLLGLGITIYGYLVHEKASSNQALKPISRNQTMTPEKLPSSPLISYLDMWYQTNDGILSANYPFNYTILVDSPNPDQIDKIEAYPWTIINGVDPPTTDSILADKKSGIVQYDYITLNRIPDSNGFIGSKINYVTTTERNIGFYLMPYTNGIARGGILIYDKDPLIIHPQIDELQAQTDRDIQKQDIDSAESNAYVFGLTIVIIGFIVLGLPLEFIVHGWLLKEDKKDNTKFSRLDENPNYYLVG